MNKYLTRKKLSHLRIILSIGIMAVLIYIYAVANGLTLPWQSKKPNKTAVLASTQKPPKPTATPTLARTPTNTPEKEYTQPASDTQKIYPAAASITLPPQAIANIKLPTLPAQVPLPDILDKKVEVKITIPF